MRLCKTENCKSLIPENENYCKECLEKAENIIKYCQQCGGMDYNDQDQDCDICDKSNKYTVAKSILSI